MQYRIVDAGDSMGKLIVKFEETAEASQRLQAPFQKIVEDIYRIEDQIFSSRGRRGGGSWKPLAESTIRRKGHDTVLQNTGDLLTSLTEPGAPYQVLDIQNNSFIFGTERPWSFVHQYGGSGVPRRPFIKFTSRDVGRWNKILTNHLMKAFES